MTKTQEVSDIDSLVVVGRQQIADRIIELTFQHARGYRLPGWSPGAHVDLALHNGLTRQYSLHGDVRDSHQWKISVLLDEASRGGSQFIHDEVDIGSKVDVVGVRNNFPFVTANRYIFIAGGIGITPLLPMVEAASARGSEWELHYGGRTLSSMAHRGIERLYPQNVSVLPEEDFGLLPLEHIVQPPQKAVVYCCGPAPLLDAVKANTRDWPSGTVRMERFAPADHGDADDLESFNVTLARTGQTFRVPSDKSILEIVTSAGIQVPRSCSEGLCGSCETDVLSGVPLHRDSVLSDEERATNETIILCVSRSKTPTIELDL